MKFDHLERFDDVDKTGEQAKFIAFLERIERFPDVRKRRERTYDLLRLAPGVRVADVGSGIGTAVLEMAARVAPTGSARGIDLSEAMVAEATRRAAARQVAAGFFQGSAAALPLEDGSLDAYRAERLYQHIADAESALAEARRVLAPGGRLALVDQDWDSTFLDADDLGTGRDIHRAFADSLVRGTVGRQFRRLLLDAGFVDVEVVAETVTNADPAGHGFAVDLFAAAARAAGLDGGRIDAWLADQRQRMARDRFFMAMTHFIATARRA